MRRWNRNHEEARFGISGVKNSMHNVRRNFAAMLGGNFVEHAVEHDRKLAREHVEELSRAFVEVRDLGSARRHSFLNHAGVLVPQQMPAIATISPRVVGGGLCGDNCHTKSSELFRGRLAAFRPVEGDPNREVRREIFEAMHLARWNEDE